MVYLILQKLEQPQKEKLLHNIFSRIKNKSIKDVYGNHFISRYNCKNIIIHTRYDLFGLKEWPTTFSVLKLLQEEKFLENENKRKIRLLKP